MKEINKYFYYEINREPINGECLQALPNPDEVTLWEYMHQEVYRNSKAFFIFANIYSIMKK